MKALLSENRFADSSSPVINLPDISRRAMSHILNLMYGEEMVIPTLEETIEVLEAMSRLQCVNFMEVMDRKMSMEVSNSFDKGVLGPVVTIWKVAKRFSLEATSSEALRGFRDNYGDFVDEHRENFLTLDFDMLLSLLDADYLIVDGEEKLFDSVMTWCRAQKAAYITLPENAMEQLLSRIEFAEMSREYYINHVETEPIVLENPSIFSIIARASVGGDIERNCTVKKRRYDVFDRFGVEDLAVGTRVMVISDIFKLKRLCKEGNQRHGRNVFGWTELKAQIAGQWYEVKKVHGDPPIITVGNERWLIPLEGIVILSKKVMSMRDFLW